MRIRSAAVTAVAVAVTPVATVLGGATSVGASEAAHPVISRAPAFDAPQGGKGGIMSPYVSCTGGELEPVVRMVLTEVSTGKKRTFRWTGALPGVHFPRVAPGYHWVYTGARCGTGEDAVAAARTQKVLIREKTARTTMSWTEYTRIKRDMTRAQVKAIVGNDGHSPSTYDGATTRTYDNMPFWRWSTVTYRDGRVISKAWDVDHD